MGFGTLAFAGLVLFMSQGLSRFGGVFVQYSAWTLVALSVFTIAMSLYRPSRQAFFESAIERRRVFSAIAVFVIFLALLPVVGFVIASFAFYIAIQYQLEEGAFSMTRWLKLMLMGVAVTGVLYLLFHQLLRVPLPAGQLFA